MGFNGSGTWVYATSGVPFVTGTVISSTVMNNLDTEIGTGFSTCIAKDGQSVTSARIPFLFGINSTLTTDSTSISTGSIITLGGIGCTKALWVGGLANIAGAVTMQSTASCTNLTVTSAGLFLGGATASDILVTRSSGILFVRLGNDSADGAVNASYYVASDGRIFLTGGAANDVLFKKTANFTVTVRKGNDSADANLVVGGFTAATVAATSVATTDLTASGTIDLGGADYSGLVSGLTNITIVKGVITAAS